jgi:hypothetical protein
VLFLPAAPAASAGGSDASPFAFLKIGRQSAMITRKSLRVVGAALLLLAMSAVTHAWIGQSNTLTFSGAVALPAGIVLPTGTYMFEMLTSGGSTEVVRVSSPDRQRTYYMGFTRSVERPRRLPSTQTIVFGEAPAGTPPPIRAWYPIDSSTGHAFIYP